MFGHSAFRISKHNLKNAFDCKIENIVIILEALYYA